MKAADPEALARTGRAATPDSLQPESAALPTPVRLSAAPQPAQVIALSRAIGNRATQQMLQRSWTDDLWGAASGLMGGQADEKAPQGSNPVEIPEVVIPVGPGGGQDAEMPESKNPVEIPEVVVPAGPEGGQDSEMPDSKNPVEIPEVEIPVDPGGGGQDAEMPESKNPVEIPEVVVPAGPDEKQSGGLWNQTAGAASEWFGSLW